MKILIDARFYGLENTGIGRYTLELVDNLAKIDRKNKYTILLKKKYFNQLNLPDNWKKVKADIKHYSLREQIVIPKIINNENPDIVHFVHFNTPIFCQKPYIVTIHDLLMHRQKGLEATTLPFYLYFVKRLGYRIVFDNAVKKSLKIITPSKFIGREIIDLYHVNSDKIATTYEGVPQQIESNISAQKILEKLGIDKPYFIYTGNAYPHKNLTRAIEAMVNLNKNSNMQVKLILVSARNVFTKRLEKLISKLKADKFVKILGFIPDSELNVLYKNSIAFIFPSLSEGFGLPGLEAMTAGTLVLVSDIPVFRETYGDVPLFFNPYDYSSIEKTMKEVILLDKNERERIIANGEKFVKKYSWDTMARQTLKVYEDCDRLRQNK